MLWTAIAAMEVVSRPVPGGQHGEIERVHKIRLWDKNAALTNLSALRARSQGAAHPVQATAARIGRRYAEGHGGDCCRCPIRWTQLFAKFGQLNNSSALFLGVSRLLGTCVTLRKDRTQVIPFVIRQNDDCACERPPLFIAEQLPDPLIFGRDPGQCYYL